MKSLILSSLLCVSLVSPALAVKSIDRDAIATVSPKYMYMAQLEYKFAKYRVGAPHNRKWEMRYARRLCRRIRRKGIYSVLNSLPDMQYRYVIRKTIRIQLAHRHLCPTQRHL